MKESDFFKKAKGWIEVVYTQDQIDMLYNGNVLTDGDNTTYIFSLHEICKRTPDNKWFITSNCDLLPKNIMRHYFLMLDERRKSILHVLFNDYKKDKK